MSFQKDIDVEIKKLMVIRLAQMGSLVAFLAVVLVLPPPETTNLKFFPFMVPLGAITVLSGYFLKRVMLTENAMDLKMEKFREDGLSVLYGHYRMVVIISGALFEIPAILGLALAFLGGAWQQWAPFFVLSAMALVLLGARRGELETLATYVNHQIG